MDETKHFYETVYGYGFNEIDYGLEEDCQRGKLLTSQTNIRQEPKWKRKRRENGRMPDPGVGGARLRV
jgi:hypothetical protein